MERGRGPLSRLEDGVNFGGGERTIVDLKFVQSAPAKSESDARRRYPRRRTPWQLKATDSDRAFLDTVGVKRYARTGGDKCQVCPRVEGEEYSGAKEIVGYTGLRDADFIGIALLFHFQRICHVARQSRGCGFPSLVIDPTANCPRRRDSAPLLVM